MTSFANLERFLNSRLIILALLLPCSISATPFLPDFETAHLKSTAGAGVGSILIDEATALNPASLAFFNFSSLYGQKNQITVTPNNDDFPTSLPEQNQWGVIISDASAGMKASFSYVRQDYLYNQRTRYALATAGSLGGKSAFGITYRYNKERLSSDNEHFVRKSYDQAVIGFNHILSESFSLGTLFIDPFNAIKRDTRALVGLQYNFKNFIAIITDIGGNYNEELADTFIYKIAIQIKVFSDFFIRAGNYSDKSKKEKGNGMGIAWVGPKLAAELALKTARMTEDENLQQKDMRMREAVFGLSLRF